MVEKCPLKLIIILSDGIAGHLNQSRGIAKWLSRLTGAEVLEADIPQLSGLAKLRARVSVRRLLGGNRRDAREWMSRAQGERLLRQVGRCFAERGLREGDDDVLLLSAGSSPAAYNLALGYIWRIHCATVMSPSFIGTEPFDFAVVPEHDFPQYSSNIFATLGSPNLVDRAELKGPAEALLAEYPPASAIKWSVLIGGDDANYVIDGEWVKSEIGCLFDAAAREGADLYITTSRRTSRSAEQALEELVAGSSLVRYVLYASRDSFNPVSAMLGFSEEVFCTDDSVNMVSEAITGGHKAILLRARRRGGVKMLLQMAVAALAEAGALSTGFIRGVPRFDAFFDRLLRRGVAVDFDSWLEVRSEGGANGESAAAPLEFNEAKRAAFWICEHWRDT